MEEVNKYVKDKIGVTIDMKLIDFGDYDQKMQVVTSSGEPYDIAFTASYTNNYLQNVSKGAFVDITDMLETHGQGIVEELDPAFLEGSKVDGRNYAIPAKKEIARQPVWRFNVNQAEALGVDYSDVQSIESLEPILAKAKEAAPSMYPLSIDKTFTPDTPFDPVIEGLPVGVPLDTEDYQIANYLDTEETMSVLNTLHSYYQAGYIRPDAATYSGQDTLKSGNWLVDKADYQPTAEKLWTSSLGYPIEVKPVQDQSRLILQCLDQCKPFLSLLSSQKKRWNS
ncbi:hypothetical protein [Litoribacterium kuwaitense]|uniref:hypothetical protein n=1 Tax=Litoribacterium kuwaitense TaxID=1398745 RepID=UPI0028A77F10|nr:hypothetical protein [Litoribacterium kuwaitense]